MALSDYLDTLIGCEFHWGRSCYIPITDKIYALGYSSFQVKDNATFGYHGDPKRMSPGTVILRVKNMYSNKPWIILGYTYKLKDDHQ